MSANQNSLVTHLKGYIQAVFKDIAWLYDKPSDWRRDQSRLLHELECHGPRVLAIDFPAIAKHLDRCLDEGTFTPIRLPYMAVGAHGYPKFLGTLWKRIFDYGKFGYSPCYGAISALRQVLLGLKKLRLNCTKRRVSDELKKFFEIEKEQRFPTLSWGGDSLFYEPRHVSWGRLFGVGFLGTYRGKEKVTKDKPFRRPHSCGDAEKKLSFLDKLPSLTLTDPWLPGLEPPGHIGQEPDLGLLRVLEQVCDRTSAQFGDLNIERSLELPKHGPGVVSNHDRKTSKFSFPEWPTKLQSVFPYDFYGTSSLGCPTEIVDEGNPRNFETPSKLITVPKTLKAPRLIAAEPSQHQWIQQLVRNQLEGRLDGTAISCAIRFRSQEQNRSLAKEGSITGLTASVDLSSASDRLSCWTVERVFRCNRSILERLHACRTRWLRNRIDPKQGEYIHLRKFAPMGSAVTFPVQSIVYACVAVASVIYIRGWKVTTASIRKAARQVSVFGDDILLPTVALSPLVSVLKYLGLEVNNQKTYGAKHFRESCGAEYVDGVDVSPAYFLNPDTSVPLSRASSQLEVANNFWRKGYWNVSKFLESTINHRESIPVVGTRDVTLGFQSFCGRVLPNRKRWNESIQQFEYRGVLNHSKVETLETEPSHRVMQWFIENPAPDTPWESGTRGRPVVTMRPGWIPSTTILEEVIP